MTEKNKLYVLKVNDEYLPVKTAITTIGWMTLELIEDIIPSSERPNTELHVFTLEEIKEFN